MPSLTLALLRLFLWLLPPPLELATVRLPSLGALVEALRSGDPVESERLARRIGAVRLLRAAEGAPARTRLAALEAIPLLDDAWAVLPQLAQLAAAGDERVGAAAAHAARRSAERLTRERAVEQELPRDVPRSIVRALVDGVRRSTDAEVRTELLRAAACMSPLATLDEASVTPLLRDAAPHVREAALEVCDALPCPSLRAAALPLLDDQDTAVACGAVAIACRHPDDLDERARGRVRHLAVDAHAPGAAPCLVAWATPEDQLLLRTLTGGKTGPAVGGRKSRHASTGAPKLK